MNIYMQAHRAVMNLGSGPEDLDPHSCLYVLLVSLIRTDLFQAWTGHRISQPVRAGRDRRMLNLST